MLIVRGYSHLEGNPQEMTNLDYYKRYMILNLPPDVESGGNSVDSLSIINISSRTGSGEIKLLSSSERVQETNRYNCISQNLWNRIPVGNLDNQQLHLLDYINLNAIISVTDVSFGVHYYDLIKGIGKDFSQITSYNQYLQTTGDEYVRYRKGQINRLLPDPLFYNDEHQLYARLTNNYKAKNALFLDNLIENYDFDIENKYGIYWRFKDFIDENTTVIVSKLEKSTILSSDESNEILEDLDMDYLHASTCGIVYDAMTCMLIDDVDFCIDSKEGISPIQYKSKHKLSTNKLYLDDIENGFLFQINYSLMNLLEQEEVMWLKNGTELRIFIKGSIENLNIGYVFYKKNGEVIRSYSYDNKNTSHNNTIDFIRNHF